MRCLLVALAIAAAPAALAQAPYEPPRTAGGHPDLQGGWLSLSLTTTERPSNITELTPSEDEAHALVEAFWNETGPVEDPDFFFANVRAFSTVKGQIRTSHIYEPKDGRLPFTPAGEALSDRGSDSSKGRNGNPEERPTYERCLAGFGQPPMRIIPVATPTQIVQTPEAVVFWTEDVAGLRIAYFNAPEPPDVIRTHNGWSSARWEGDTLVIKTTHLRPDDHWRNDFGRPIVVDADSVIFERFTRIAADELLYEFWVEDDDLYAKPWRAEFSFRRFDTPVLEYACHEANYSIVNVLLAGRVEDAREAAKAKKSAKAKKN
jgi:hypothetical protein